MNCPPTETPWRTSPDQSAQTVVVAPHILPQPPGRLLFYASIFKYDVRAHCGHYGAPSPPCTVPARPLGTHGFIRSNNDSCGGRWIRGICGPAQPSDAPAALLLQLHKTSRQNSRTKELRLFIQPRGTRQVWDVFFERVQFVHGSGNVRAAFSLREVWLFSQAEWGFTFYFSGTSHFFPTRCSELQRRVWGRLVWSGAVNLLTAHTSGAARLV